MSIGPNATVIAYLLSLAAIRDLVGDRVAARHEFSQVTLPDEQGRGWEYGAAAITLRLDGADGAPDMAACGAQHRVRLDTRCWGESSEAAEAVWATLMGVVYAFQRGPVTLDSGERALLQYLAPLDGPFAEVDPDTGLDYVRATLRAGVAGEPV